MPSNTGTPETIPIQRILSMVPVLVLVNVMQLSWHTMAGAGADINDATGIPPDVGVPVKYRLSTAKEGSDPMASSLLVQLKPILIPGLWSALAGSGTVIYCHIPPKAHVVGVFGVFSSRLHEPPS